MKTQVQSSISLNKDLNNLNISSITNENPKGFTSQLGFMGYGTKTKKNQKIMEEKDKKIQELESEKAHTQEALLQFYFHVIFVTLNLVS